MQDYRVQLDVYHGPLDLLLYLIKREEVDIHDIPIARITEQYLRHVEAIQRLDINLAGEFLVMAATLMEIKSAMMSPRERTDIAEGEGNEAAALAGGAGAGGGEQDPRYELVRQLLAYKRFRDAAAELDRRREHFAARFPRVPAAERAGAASRPEREPPEVDLEDASVWDLLGAFTSLMEQVGTLSRTHDVVDDDTPIELHGADVLDRLGREGPMTLQRMFAGRRMGEMIGLFLALLELLRQRKVRAWQETVGGEIRLEPRPKSEWIEHGEGDEGEESAGWRFDPEDADNFDWPDEEQRRRYIRRLKRRAAGEKVEEDEQLEADIAELEARENRPPPNPDDAPEK